MTHDLLAFNPTEVPPVPQTIGVLAVSPIFEEKLISDDLCIVGVSLVRLERRADILRATISESEVLIAAWPLLICLTVNSPPSRQAHVLSTGGKYLNFDVSSEVSSARR